MLAVFQQNRTYALTWLTSRRAADTIVETLLMPLQLSTDKMVVCVWTEAKRQRTGQPL